MPEQPVILRVSALGWCGKAPSEGDFIGRGLPPADRRALEDWMSRGLAAARRLLGGALEGAWSTAPLWRFAVRPGLLTERFALGVIGPSVDSVGRLYPLCVAALADGDADPIAVLGAARTFLAEAEAATLDALDPAADAAARFAALRPPAALRVAAPAAGAKAGTAEVRVAADGQPLPGATGGDSAWITIGGEIVPPQGFALRGAPDPDEILPRLLRPEARTFDAALPDLAAGLEGPGS